MRPFAELKPLGRAVERFFLPGECLLCQAPVDGVASDPLVCGLCRSRWVALPPPLCQRCGQPVEAGLDCRVCREWPAALGRVRSAVWFEGSVRLAVHHLKYQGWWRVAEAAAEPMRRLEPLEPGVTLVPIPLGRSREQRRGYNQSERLARTLGHMARLPLRAEWLRRVRETPTQTTLTPEARQANVAGAFEASGARGKRVVLVDDVFTTGATLVAAALSLSEAGASRIEAVTFARAKGPVG